MSADTTATEPTPLEAFDEDWQTALAVVAHPDDMEWGFASVVARWTRQGKRVVYVMVTSGEAGIDGIEPDRSGPLREAEEIASARVVGVDDVVFLREPDGVLEYGVRLRERIAREIRRHRPDVVVTNNIRETWESGALNQADHIATGRSTIEAARDAGNRWVFREQLEGPDAVEPWGGVRAIVLPGSPDLTHAVDVTDTFDTGVDSLREHRAYLDGLGDGAESGVLRMLDEQSRGAGHRAGVERAVAIEVLAL